MAKLDRLKEEIGWLKVIFSILIAIDISLNNKRIKSIDNNQVIISYKDYKDNNKEKELKLTGKDFIERFLFHILPPNYHKIRYYGILANGNNKKREKILKSLIEAGKAKKISPKVLFTKLFFDLSTTLLYPK
ncbi:Transposase, IS801/IS1294, partial [Candidatus Magnetomorum sp. HK-1]